MKLACEMNRLWIALALLASSVDASSPVIRPPVASSKYATVTFDPRNGDAVITNVVEIGKEMGRLPEAKRVGFVFMGWMGSPTPGGPCINHETIVTGDASYYAYWLAGFVYVNFDLGGKGVHTGGGALKQAVMFGDSAVAPEVAPNDGYRFVGWDSDLREMENNIVVHALWQRDTSVRIPELTADATADTVNATLDDILLVDGERIKAAIGGNATKYREFRAWTKSMLDGEWAVMTSEHASESFMFGTSSLLGSTPVVEIGEVETVCAANGVRGTENAGVGVDLLVSVTVKDGTRVVAATSAKVAAMFEATSDLGDWNGVAKLEPEVTDLTEGVSDVLRFSVSPGAASSAFLRIKAK